MNIQPPDYDRAEQELREENKYKVLDLLDKQDSGLLRRIRTFANNFGFDEAVVCEKIRKDFMFACWFAKNPTKMRVHEKTAGKYLKQFPQLIQSFESLKVQEKNAKYMDKNGNIVSGRQPQNGSKSLDFMWRAGDTYIKCFAAHKFTREKGGSQNHQRDELIRLLQMFQNCKDENIALFAICDGPYYDDQNLSLLLQHVRREPPFSFACSIEEVPKNVEKLIKGQAE